MNGIVYMGCERAGEAVHGGDGFRNRRCSVCSSGEDGYGFHAVGLCRNVLDIAATAEWRNFEAPSFTAATSVLQSEVVDNTEFTLFTVSDLAIFRSVGMMQKHNLNSTDAAILTVMLEVAGSSDAPLCVLVASDQRLLRAADLEGLRTLNPELTVLADVPAFLASL